MMDLEFDYQIALQNGMDDNLVQNIEFLKLNYNCVKFGVTNFPAFQALKHDKKNWAKMIVKHQFNCFNKIEHFENIIKNQNIELIKNELDTAIDQSNNFPYYLYFLLK